MGYQGGLIGRYILSLFKWILVIILFVLSVVICVSHYISRVAWEAQIKSIEKQIQDRSKSLAAADAEERAVAQADIQRLQQQLTNFFSQFSDWWYITNYK